MSSNHHYQTPSALQQHGCGDYQPQQTKYHQQNHNVWLYPIMHGGSTATPTQQQACDYEREQAKSRRSNDPVWLYPTMHGGSTETPSFPRSLDSRYGCVPPSPRTPPPRRTGSASRQLISPPIPHRVTAQRHYPVTAVAPCIESIGNPSLQIFRLKLPTALMARLNGIVAHSEQYAQTLPDGWRTGLYSLTKQDMALREVPGMHHRIQPIVDFLVKCIQHLYSCRKVICDKNQPHILKYSIRSGHTGVELHHDRCDVTVNLCLSDSHEYEGGGTFFPELGSVIKLERGEFLIHPGSLVHCGMNLTGGTRYLMVLFAHLSKDV